MSKYASKWASCTREEYFEIYNALGDKARVYSTYTNPNGDDGISCQPEIFTSWGSDEKELIRCNRTKENREQVKWDDVHGKAIEWEEED